MTTRQDTVPPTVESVWDAVVGMRRTVRWLGSLDLGFLLDEDVDALLPEVEEAARVVPVVQQALTAQVLDRGLAEAYGCTSPVAYLQAKLRLRRPEANARVGAAERFQPRTGMTGEKLQPRLPVVADLCLVGRYASRIEAHLDPDGVLATEQENRASQELFLRKDVHGMWRLSGRFDAESAATIQAALSLLAKPQEQPDGGRDPRPAPRRRAEALTTILGWSLDHDRQPTTGGSPPHVSVTISLAELEARLPGRLTTGDPVSAEAIERMLCDADTTLTVFGHTGEVLYHGRDARTAPPGLRKAVIARDKGCTHYGRDAPEPTTHPEPQPLTPRDHESSRGL